MIITLVLELQGVVTFTQGVVTFTLGVVTAVCIVSPKDERNVILSELGSRNFL